MAIIQYARRNSGSETALKVLQVNTDGIFLRNGKILISQVFDNVDHSIKLSLYVTKKFDQQPLHKTRTIGERNVWLRDVSKGIMIIFAHEREAKAGMRLLNVTHDWEQAFPETNRLTYQLKHLDRAAAHIRNFLLFGILPTRPLSDEQKEFIERTLGISNPEYTKVEVDIVSTLDPELVELFDNIEKETSGETTRHD